VAGAVEKKFASALPGALADDKKLLKLISFIKNDIKTEADLTACLDHLCKVFDPADAKQQRARKEAGLTTGYNLFIRSTVLAGQLNNLLSLIPDSKAGKAARDLPRKKLWEAISEKDRKDLDAAWNTARRRIDNARTLITPLVTAYFKKHQQMPDLDQLLSFDPTGNALRKEFETIVGRCSSTWGMFGYGQKNRPTPENLKKLDDDFASFSTFLNDRCADPLNFFQVLKWVREGGLKVVKRRDDTGTYFEPTPVWDSIWHELYLDACYYALNSAVSSKRWNLLAVQLSVSETRQRLTKRGKQKPVPDDRLFPRDDFDFFIAPLPQFGKDSSREHVARRLEYAFLPGSDFLEVTRARRRSNRFASFSIFELLDEFETVALENRIIMMQATDPDAITRMYIRTSAEQLVWNDKFRVGQTVMEDFTIIWIEERDGVPWVTVEFHAMSGVLFRMRSGELRTAVQNAFFKTLARNAAALAVFLLAYLELLGLVVDVLTAGASGGLRQVFFKFIKERVKDKLVDKGLDAAGVDNQALRIFAGMGANALKVPKFKGSKAADDLTDFDPKLGRSTQDVPPAEAPKPTLREADATIDKPRDVDTRPRSADEIGALQKEKISGVQKFDQRRAAVEQQKSAQQQVELADTKPRAMAADGGGGRVVDAPVGNVRSNVSVPTNGVNRPAGGAPIGSDRVNSKIPTAVPAKSTDETVQRIIAERHVPNPMGSKKSKVDATPEIMDAQTRKVLGGKSQQTELAGTGGIDTIKATKARNGEMEVTIDGVLLPGRLARKTEELGQNNSMAPNFNAGGPSNQFSIQELEIKGPRDSVSTMERAHLWGPGFGDEAGAGLFLAPKKINQVWQNQMAEKYIRGLASQAGTKGGFVRLSATATSYGTEVSMRVGKGGERFLKSVEYRIELHMPGQPVRHARVKLKVPEPPVSDAFMDTRNVWDFVEAEGMELMRFAK
jgi:hypothetical protein